MSDRLDNISANLKLSQHSEGLVVFNLDSGKIFNFNSAGARIFFALYKGQTLDAVSAELMASCGADLQTAQRIADAFAEELKHHSLWNNRPPSKPPSRWFVACRALYELALYDVTMATAGFRGVWKRLKSDCVSTGPADPALTALLCDGINLALSLYFKRVQCLQRSITTAHVLWKYGIACRVAIAYRSTSFMSHAYVEAGGLVINDSSEYARLRVLCKF